MAVVGLVEIKGDPKQLLAQYDKAREVIEKAPPPPGLLIHTCVELPDGMRIANVWESEEQLWAGFNNPQFQSAVRNAGMEPVKPTVLRVHNFIPFAQAQVR